MNGKKEKQVSSKKINLSRLKNCIQDVIRDLGQSMFIIILNYVEYNIPNSTKIRENLYS